MDYFLSFSCLSVTIAFAFGIARLSLGTRGAVSQRGRIGCLDGLRGYLALAVVAHHYLGTWNIERSGAFTVPDGNLVFQNLGPTAVLTFFMITALLFYGKLLRSGGRPNWKALYISRIFRLTPAYWVALTAVLFLLFYLSNWTLHVPLRSLMVELFNWIAFTIPGAVDINGFPRTGQVLFGVVWTLRYEWLFYFCLPLVGLAVMVGRDYPAARFGTLVACVAVVGFGPEVTVAHFSSTYALPFLLGMIAAELQAIDYLRRLTQGVAGTIVGLASLLVLLALPPDIGMVERAPFLLMFFLPVVAGNSYLGLLSKGPSIVLGDASYSIYLLHVLALRGLPIVFGADVYRNFSLVEGWLAMIPVAVVVVVVSILNYRYVERPFIDLGHRFSRTERKSPVLAKAGS